MLGCKNRKLIVRTKRSKLCICVLNVFYKEGLIRGFSFSLNNPYELLIFLKYSNEKPLIKRLERISSSGRRVFVNSRNLLNNFVYNGFFLLSTSKGLLLSTDLLKTRSFTKFGGEVLFKIII
jgi:small subunit ribosomal protein S8